MEIIVECWHCDKAYIADVVLDPDDYVECPYCECQYLVKWSPLDAD